MDLNTARTVLTQMQACFMELDLKIVTESEALNQEVCSDYLNFRSYAAGDDCLAQLQAFVWPDYRVIQISMYLQQEMTETTIATLLTLMNDINVSSSGAYWTAIPGLQRIEFRTAYILAGDQLNKEQFKRILKKFVDQGLLQCSYLKKRVKNSGGLIN
jgi:hypothetical protein